MINWQTLNTSHCYYAYVIFPCVYLPHANTESDVIQWINPRSVFKYLYCTRQTRLMHKQLTIFIFYYYRFRNIIQIYFIIQIYIDIEIVLHCLIIFTIGCFIFLSISKIVLFSSPILLLLLFLPISRILLFIYRTICTAIFFHSKKYRILYDI